MAKYPNATHLTLSFSHSRRALPVFFWLAKFGLPASWAAWLYVKMFCKIRVTGEGFRG